MTSWPPTIRRITASSTTAHNRGRSGLLKTCCLAHLAGELDEPITRGTGDAIKIEQITDAARLRLGPARLDTKDR
jgi:hypothetical protein